ncbi:MAG: hypothetical protein LBV44_03660 [Methylobacillus sp.]|nr:hypothetical protein [Methylobacillus sp.]
MFDRITIVNVDGRIGDLHETQLALHYSATQMPGARCLLLSPTKPKKLLPLIEHIPIVPMGHLEYSLFVTYALHQFIDTEFALIVQNDGWVLNGASFLPEFFEYDYLGAPTGLADVLTPDGKKTFVRRFTWVQRMLESRQTPGFKINYSMNGGFSLRSKKFLQTPSQLGLEYRLRPPTVSRNRVSRYAMQWPSGDAWEDVYHCVINRDMSDKVGILFPPLSVGLKFAFEHLHPHLHEGMDISKIFGHHMGARRLTSLDPLTIRFTWLERELLTLGMEDVVFQTFKKLGYKLEFPPG